MEALMIPGQGAQKPEILTPWLELPEARSLLSRWSERCALDLLRLGTEADAATIADTAVAQPLLTATALLAASTMPRPRRAEDLLVAGHSVGELAALAVAGVIDPGDAVVLAAARGRAMAQACTAEPTGMAAVLGGTPASVATALVDADLEVANVNGAGQIVVAGPVERIQALADAGLNGFKVRKLQVSGAFHTRFMSAAMAPFAAAANAVPVTDPRCVLLSNVDGRVVTSGMEAIALVKAQLVRPVRWDLCMRTMERHGVTRLVELPPAGTLIGIARRALPGLPTVPIKSPDDLAVMM